MSVNKYALIRYRVLDRCFSNPGRRFFIEDLLKECNAKLAEINTETKGIQRRQLFDDINYMESAEGWNAEIIRIPWGKKKYYRYKDPDFSISKSPLNEAEEAQLRSALDIVSRFSGMPQFQWISEFTSKIDSDLVTGPIQKTIISFDNNAYLTGIERLSDLYFAILYKKPLSVLYHPFKSVDSQISVIHPYYLKQYNNRWFLLGYNAESDNLTNFALDRIKRIDEVQVEFIENDKYDFDEYFEDIVGVTRLNLPLEKIVLYFNRDTAPYIMSKPLHGSQKIVRNSTDGVTLSLDVIPNYELETLLLSFGENVLVISPVKVKQKIAKRIEEASKNYKATK